MSFVAIALALVASDPAVPEAALIDASTFEIDGVALDRLPLPRDVASYATLAPGTLLSSPDAAAAAQAMRTTTAAPRLSLPSLSIHGGGASGNALYLDGVDVTDPASGGVIVTRLPVAAIERLRVDGANIDVAKPVLFGGAVDVTTRSGSDELRVYADVFWRPHDLQARDAGDVIPNDAALDDTITASLAVGGPVIKRRLWFFAAGEFERATGVQQAPSIVFADTQTPPPQTTRFVGFGKLTWQPIPIERVTLFITGDPASVTNVRQTDGFDLGLHPKAERQAVEAGSAMALSSATTLLDDVVWNNTLSYVTRRSLLVPQSGDIDTAPHVNLGTGTSTVNDDVIRDDKRGRFALTSELAWQLHDIVGEHGVVAGAAVAFGWDQLLTSVPGNQVFIDSGIGRADSTIDGAGDPFRLAEVAPLRVDASAADAAVFAEDAWRPLHNVLVRPGVRVDLVNAGAAHDDVDVDVLAAQTVSPRINVAWDPFDDGKTALRGGYAWLNDAGARGALALARFAAAGADERSATVFEFNPLTGQYDTLVSSDADTVLPAQAATPPSMHEITAGVAREILPLTIVSIDGMWRRRDSLFVARETNLVRNDRGEVVGFNDGGPHAAFAVETQPNAFAQYLGVDVAIAKHFGDDWQLLATYTLSSTTGSKSGDALLGSANSDPTQAAIGDAAGALSDDVRHNVSVAASIDLPFGFGLATRTAWRSGRPASKLFDDSTGAFVDLRAPRGVDPKNVDDTADDVELRLPDALTIDVRARWSLRELTGVDAAVVVDVFDVVNSRPTTAIEERDVADAITQFGDPIARSAPLRAQLGLQYRL